MEKFFFCFIASALFITSSCKKDDCETGTLSSTLIGEWSIVTEFGPLGDVKFQQDGTLIDPEDALAGGESGTGQPLDQKSYTVNGDASFEATASDGSTSITIEYDVIELSCNEIKIDILGFDATMTRK